MLSTLSAFAEVRARRGGMTECEYRAGSLHRGRFLWQTRCPRGSFWLSHPRVRRCVAFSRRRRQRGDFWARVWDHHKKPGSIPRGNKTQQSLSCGLETAMGRGSKGKSARMPRGEALRVRIPTCCGERRLGLRPVLLAWGRPCFLLSHHIFPILKKPSEIFS